MTKLNDAANRAKSIAKHPQVDNDALLQYIRESERAQEQDKEAAVFSSSILQDAVG